MSRRRSCLPHRLGLSEYLFGVAIALGTLSRCRTHRRSANFYSRPFFRASGNLQAISWRTSLGMSKWTGLSTNKILITLLRFFRFVAMESRTGRVNPHRKQGEANSCKFEFDAPPVAPFAGRTFAIHRFRSPIRVAALYTMTFDTI